MNDLRYERALPNAIAADARVSQPGLCNASMSSSIELLTSRGDCARPKRARTDEAGAAEGIFGLL